MIFAVQPDFPHHSSIGSNLTNFFTDFPINYFTFLDSGKVSAAAAAAAASRILPHLDNCRKINHFNDEKKNYAVPRRGNSTENRKRINEWSGSRSTPHTIAL